MFHILSYNIHTNIHQKSPQIKHIINKIVIRNNDIFKGNRNLKRCDVQIDWTPDLIAEYHKCSQDPVYFIQNYYTIVSLDKGKHCIDLYPYQKDIINKVVDNRFTVCRIGRQMGKALTLDTPIPTPNGWKTMGSLEVGDKIFAGDGTETTVTFRTETMYDHVVYNVTMDNGEVIKADADHQWTISTNVSNGGKPQVVTTKQMVELLNKAKKQRQSVKIQGHDGVEYPHQEVPIDPYLLGMWLGDGNKSDGRIHSSLLDYDEISANIRKAGYSVSGYVRDNRTKNALRFSVYDLYPILRKNNLLANKHIPKIYEFNSRDVRIALIQGLMDSDGSVEKNGRCEFYQKDLNITMSVKRILSSLGVKVRTKRKTIGGEMYYTLLFCTNKFPVFKLTRKLKRQTNGGNSCVNYNYYIKTIEETKSEPVRCIQVDHPSHLFLCSHSYVPTHNTTTAAAVLLWYVLFNKDMSIAILAHKLSGAREILSRLQLAYEGLPKWLQQGVKVWTKTNIELENGSKILASATSGSAVRGGSFSFLYLDELAFVPRHTQEEFFASVYPTISSGKNSKILITSTPNGLDMFHSIWKKAKLGENNYVPIDVHWSDMPGRDEEWKKETIRNTSAEQFRVEYDCEFIGSANTLLSAQALISMAPEEPIYVDDDTKQYVDKQEGHTYVLTVDTARGVAGDYSAFIVFDVSKMPYTIVARYRNNDVSPMVYPSVIQKWAKYYNDAYILVETNDIGLTIAQNLQYELETENVLTTVSKGGKGQQLSSGFSSGSKLGVRTTTAVKRIGCLNLKTIIEREQLRIIDKETIEEFSQFITKANSWAAETGSHDDLVMCCVLFAWLTTQDVFMELCDNNVRATLQEQHDNTAYGVNTPFGTIVTGEDDEEDDEEFFFVDDDDNWIKDGGWTTSGQSEGVYGAF